MRRHWPILFIAFVGLGAIAVNALTPRPKRFDTIEGRPLLEQDGSQFVDAQEGLRFEPPAEWGMQVRSTEASTHRPERLLVKYKRVLPDSPVAWLRVRVIDVPAEQLSGEYLRKCKPPEAGFQAAGEIEENLIVGGQPAAKLTFTGPYDVDGRGAKTFQCDVVAIRRGDQIFEFAGTFSENDTKAKDQLKSTLESVTFSH